MFETEIEKAAAAYGGAMAGEYLESIGKFSLADLTPQEWETFCEVMCCNYHDRLITPNQEPA